VIYLVKFLSTIEVLVQHCCKSCRQAQTLGDNHWHCYVAFICTLALLLFLKSFTCQLM